MKASWFSFHGEKLCTLIEGSPITQNGFLAKRSRPCHPLYRQQQPADQIRMMYSSPNTTIITNSYKDKERHFQVYLCGCALVSFVVVKMITLLTSYITAALHTSLLELHSEISTVHCAQQHFLIKKHRWKCPCLSNIICGSAISWNKWKITWL